jgi:elongation factor P
LKLKEKGRNKMADVYMAGDLRNNNTFELEGNVFKVVEFQHVKPGKGAAFVRVKMKNVITGAVIERTFKLEEKVHEMAEDIKELKSYHQKGGV